MKAKVGTTADTCSTLISRQHGYHSPVSRFQLHIYIPWLHPSDLRHTFAAKLNAFVRNGYGLLAVRAGMCKGSLELLFDFVCLWMDEQGQGAGLAGASPDIQIRLQQLQNTLGGHSLPSDLIMGILQHMELGWPAGAELFVQTTGRSFRVRFTPGADRPLAIDEVSEGLVHADTFDVASPVCVCTQAGSSSITLLAQCIGVDPEQIHMVARCQGITVRFKLVQSRSAHAKGSSGSRANQASITVSGPGASAVSSTWQAELPLASPCSLVMLECWHGRTSCIARPMLVVNSENIGQELQQLEVDLELEPRHAATWVDCTIKDLGYWFEYVTAMRLGPVQVTDAVVHDEHDDAMDLSSICISSCHDPEYQDKMRQTAANLLAYCCDHGWRHLGTKMLQDLAEIGAPLDQVTAPRPPYGLTLLHCAVRCQQLEMVAAVVQWGRRYGQPWSWDSPAHLGLTPLHLAAALRDGGAMAAFILTTYPETQALWHTVQDASGSTPAMLAARYSAQGARQGPPALTDSTHSSFWGSSAADHRSNNGAGTPSTQLNSPLTTNQLSTPSHPPSPTHPGRAAGSSQPGSSEGPATDGSAGPATDGSGVAATDGSAAATANSDSSEQVDGLHLVTLKGALKRCWLYFSPPRLEHQYLEFLAKKSFWVLPVWMVAQIFCLVVMTYKLYQDNTSTTSVATVGVATPYAVLLVLLAIRRLGLYMHLREPVLVIVAVLRSLFKGALGLGLLPLLLSEYSFRLISVGIDCIAAAVTAYFERVRAPHLTWLGLLDAVCSAFFFHGMGLSASLPVALCRCLVPNAIALGVALLLEIQDRKQFVATRHLKLD